MTQPAQAPTRTRYWVIVFAVTLSIITYIDRVCISQAAPFISRDLGLTDTQMGWALSAFAWAYALFEIPGGWLGDAMGPRKVLMRVVVWWSFFTAATAWAWNFLSLVVIRFLFGAGEAGCFPNLTKAFTVWLPKHERVRAQGIMWMSARWGGAFTPALVAWIISILDWRRSFEIFGIIGVVWAVFFYRWFRDNPGDHPKVNAAEIALLEGAEKNASGHGDVPWARMLASRAVWLLWLQYFFLSYGWYFYITWLPTYLQRVRGFDLKSSAILAGLPLFLGGIGCLVSGWLLPRVARRVGSDSTARRLISSFGLAMAAILLVVSANTADPLIAVFIMAMASFMNDLNMPASWGACMSIGGKYAGTLSGSMNMMGNAGGALCPIAVAYILQWTGNNWAMAFYVSAAMYAAGVVCWLLLDSSHAIDEG
jgi:MFS family permease